MLRKSAAQPLRTGLALHDLEANHFGVRVAFGDVVHRHSETLTLRMCAGYCVRQIWGEGSNAAFARRSAVADETNLQDFEYSFM